CPLSVLSYCLAGLIKTRSPTTMRFLSLLSAVTFIVHVSTIKDSTMPQKGLFKALFTHFYEFAVPPYQRYKEPRHEYESSDPQYVDERFLERFQHHPVLLPGCDAQGEVAGFRVDGHERYPHAELRDFIRNPAHHFVFDHKIRFRGIGHPITFDRDLALHGHVLIRQFHAGYLIHTLDALQCGNVIVHKKRLVDFDPYFFGFAPVVTGFAGHFHGNVGVQIPGERPADIGGGYNTHLLVCLHAWILYELDLTIASEVYVRARVGRIDCNSLGPGECVVCV